MAEQETELQKLTAHFLGRVWVTHNASRFCVGSTNGVLFRASFSKARRRGRFVSEGSPNPVFNRKWTEKVEGEADVSARLAFLAAKLQLRINSLRAHFAERVHINEAQQTLELDLGNGGRFKGVYRPNPPQDVIELFLSTGQAHAFAARETIDHEVNIPGYGRIRLQFSPSGADEWGVLCAKHAKTGGGGKIFDQEGKCLLDSKGGTFSDFKGFMIIFLANRIGTASDWCGPETPPHPVFEKLSVR